MYSFARQKSTRKAPATFEAREARTRGCSPLVTPKKKALSKNRAVRQSAQTLFRFFDKADQNRNEGNRMGFQAKQFAGSHCGCRYQQDYRPTLGRDGKKESGTLEVIKFYYDGAIRFEQHCYGEAATFVFGVWASGMDEDGTLHWVLPDRRKSYYDEAYLPKKLDRVDEAGNLYFDGSKFPWKLADDFEEDKRWGYPRWKVLLGRLTGKGKG